MNNLSLSFHLKFKRLRKLFRLDLHKLLMKDIAHLHEAYTIIHIPVLG